MHKLFVIFALMIFIPQEAPACAYSNDSGYVVICKKGICANGFYIDEVALPDHKDSCHNRVIVKEMPSNIHNISKYLLDKGVITVEHNGIYKINDFGYGQGVDSKIRNILPKITYTEFSVSQKFSKIRSHINEYITPRDIEKISKSTKKRDLLNIKNIWLKKATYLDNY